MLARLAFGLNRRGLALRKLSCIRKAIDRPLWGHMAAKGSKTYEVVFSIVWNASRRTFDIERDGKPTGSFAKDRNTAIGLAGRAAQFETREGRTAVVYGTNADGKRVVVWSA